MIVAYERNPHSIVKMRRAAAEVVEIAGFELGKSHGGGHRMICPFQTNGI
jgi:arginine deiminase